MREELYNKRAMTDIEKLRQKAKVVLKSRGLTDDQLRQMALNYKNGDGMAAAVLEKYKKK